MLHSGVRPVPSTVSTKAGLAPFPNDPVDGYGLLGAFLGGLGWLTGRHAWRRSLWSCSRRLHLLDGSTRSALLLLALLKLGEARLEFREFGGESQDFGALGPLFPAIEGVDASILVVQLIQQFQYGPS